MFMLISVWGSGDRRHYSALKFVLYTVFGSAFMLARLAHAFGMESPKANPFRAAGMLVTLLLLTVLAVIAVLIALGRF